MYNTYLIIRFLLQSHISQSKLITEQEQNLQYGIMGKCKYNKEWENDRPWLEAYAGDLQKGWCKVCSQSFSVKEGSSALAKHSLSQKHIDAIGKQNNPAKCSSKQSQQSLESAFEKARIKSQEERKVKEDAIRAEAMLSTMLANHGLPIAVSDCLNTLLPQIFHDSKIAASMSFGRTKAGYLITDGLGPYYHQKIVNNMKHRPFSINVDESTVNKKQQININASIVSDTWSILKVNYTTLEVIKSSSGKDLAEAILNEFQKEDIPYRNLVSVQTDGCNAMIGRFGGLIMELRKMCRWLPNFGGCESHDASNILKHGVKAMNKNLINLYSCLWGNLEKHSVKKTREYIKECKELEMEYQHVPKFIEVRFRIISKLASFMERNDRSLYVHYKNLADDFKIGKIELSETEMKIIEIYIKNYIEIRLLNKFLIWISKPFVDFIDFFESREIRVQYRWDKMFLMLSEHLSKFLKNGGINNKTRPTVSDLLGTEYSNKDKLLSNDEVAVGADVRSFIRKIGLSPNSPELKNYYQSIFRFYQESTKFMIKYFSIPVKSTNLRYLGVLNPTVNECNLDTLKKKLVYLGEKFPNIQTEENIEELKIEAVRYFHLNLHSNANEERQSVEEFINQLRTIKIENELQFTQLVKLFTALATIYNCSSEVERDFSKQNIIYSNSKRHALTQEMTQASLSIMSSSLELARDCKRCNDMDTERKKRVNSGEKVERRQIKHCHCSFMAPEPSLMDDLKNHGPRKRYFEKFERSNDENSEAEMEAKRQRLDNEAQDDLEEAIRIFKLKPKDDTNASSSSRSIKKRVPVKMTKKAERREEDTKRLSWLMN